MGAAAPGEKTKTLERTQIAVERIGQSLLEPADGSGADAGEDDARGPGLAQDSGSMENPPPPSAMSCLLFSGIELPQGPPAIA
jgi:hypothetical protein